MVARRNILGEPSQVGKVIAFTIVGAALALVALAPWTGPSLKQIYFLWWGLLAVLALYGVAVWVTGSFDPLAVTMGTDGRPSTSKFQFFFWTAIVIFGYVSYFVERMQRIDWSSSTHAPLFFAGDLPRNVLIAMGFSVVTVAGAKGITVSYLASGSISKEPGTKGGLMSTDDGLPDLTKIQMLIWTLIAAVCFVYEVVSADPLCKPLSTQNCFPDIDGALMVLMGLGHGAYLGKKLVSTDTPPSPTITRLNPLAAQPNDVVKIEGSDFGTTVNGSKILFDGIPLSATPLSWEDEAITFRVPSMHPNGTPWSASQEVKVSVQLEGQATNVVRLTVE